MTTSDMGDGYYAHARDAGARVHSDSWGYHDDDAYPTASRGRTRSRGIIEPSFHDVRRRQLGTRRRSRTRDVQGAAVQR